MKMKRRTKIDLVLFVLFLVVTAAQFFMGEYSVFYVNNIWRLITSGVLLFWIVRLGLRLRKELGQEK